jgi:SAM-dependent methyltransferase
MNTVITRENPFGRDRYGFAWEHIPAGGVHLDFGCSKGGFLEGLRNRGFKELIGVDISRNAVIEARKRLADIEIVHIHRTTPLPFKSFRFESISLLDVFEHIYEQKELLRELCRLLKDDGVLIVTVPGKHIFSFLDVGNLKFRFPRLHRWYVCRKYSEQEYISRYVSNPDGLVGDISAKKRWHEHFSRSSLRALLNESGFKVVMFDGSCLFGRLIAAINIVFSWLGPLRPLMRRLSAADAKRFKSANLFCVCRKIGH